MDKKIWVIAFIVLAIVVGLKINSSRAQRESDSDKVLANIEKKLDELAASYQENKDIARKLDQVLSNQQKILSELDIVKVRCSLRR